MTTKTPFGKGYSNIRDASTYPLHEGAVVKIKSSVTKKRRDISKSDPDVEHQMFFWIQRISAHQPGSRQERLARIMVVLVPNRPGCERLRIIYELTERNRVQLETLKKWMRLWGHKHLGDIPFRQRRRDYGKFYRMIGLSQPARGPVVRTVSQTVFGRPQSNNQQK